MGSFVCEKKRQRQTKPAWLAFPNPIFENLRKTTTAITPYFPESYNSILEFPNPIFENLRKKTTAITPYFPEEVILGVNGVAMDRHGLILWENEATGSKKVFRCLLDLRDAIF